MCRCVKSTHQARADLPASRRSRWACCACWRSIRRAWSPGRRCWRPCGPIRCRPTTWWPKPSRNCARPSVSARRARVTSRPSPRAAIACWWTWNGCRARPRKIR